jgi:hypothetical protein
MPCECSVAGLFAIEYDGIISAQITGSSEFIEIISNCDDPVNVFSEVRKSLKGPSTGTLNLTAYAFPKGSTNKYLGTSCPSTAGIDLPTQSRFDCENNITRFIRTKTGQAFREGDPIDGITLLGNLCSFRSVNASAQGGAFNQVTDTTRTIGTDLIWTGLPIALDSRDPDSLDLTILGLDVKLTSFNISVTAPSVATNSYTFQFSIPGCEGALI